MTSWWGKKRTWGVVVLAGLGVVLAVNCYHARKDNRRAQAPAQAKAPSLCSPSREWADVFQASSISIHVDLKFDGRSADLDLTRSGDGFNVDGTFGGMPPKATRVSVLSAHEVEKVLCQFASHKLLGPPWKTSNEWTDDYPEGEIVFRFEDRPPMRLFFLDQKRQWILARWAELEQVLEDDPEKPGERVHHKGINDVLWNMLAGLGPAEGSQPPPRSESVRGATSLTIDDVYSGGARPFLTRIELVTVGGNTLATIRMSVGFSWHAHTFSTKVSPSMFEAWLEALEAARREQPADASVVVENGQPRQFVARVPGSRPSFVPADGHTAALEGEIMTILDMKKWAEAMFDRGEDDGWR